MPISEAKHITAKGAQTSTAHGVQAEFGLDVGDSRELTFGRYVIEPNAVLPAHVHTSDSIAYCISGSCTFEIGADSGEIFEMRPGDYVYVPAGVTHTELTGPNGVELIIARDRQGGETEILGSKNKTD